MTNMFEDEKVSNITEEERAALKIILHSKRGALLVEQLLKTFATIDDGAPAYFVNLITKINQIHSDKLNSKLHTMRGCIDFTGRLLTNDKPSHGANKGIPRFLSDNFKDTLDMCNWNMLEYVQTCSNFMEFKHEVECGYRMDMVKASQVCQCNDLAKTYLLQFCKFLDGLDTPDCSNLVNPLVYKQNPGLKEMVDWCREHRDEWDDISNNVEEE